MVLPNLNERAGGEHPGNVGEYALWESAYADDRACCCHLHPIHVCVGGAHHECARDRVPAVHGGAHGRGVQ